MDPVSGLCEGCYRTLNEIAAWGSASDEQRHAILARVARRREKAPDPWQGALRCDCED
jgi:predicted Fe-S protein YdhL (DUF1289 family)